MVKHSLWSSIQHINDTILVVIQKSDYLIQIQRQIQIIVRRILILQS